MEFIEARQKELKVATKTKTKKIIQRIKVASNLLKSNQRPEWFILEALPIIPPDLRPMIQLDWGRFASSDLNDLYRRVINRNNRLKKLIELGAPDVILKNEKRMLQESVDMLITGETRTNRSNFVSANKKKLKSLTEVLKWKQGRFRQNLLGKRVDYSGRSVIIVGPNLKMNECGLPKKMALTLFKPFIIGKLIEEWISYNVKHAERIIDEWGKAVWDALDEVIDGKYVLMNRAPTLHRLSIQAFKPKLIDGKAIQLHPLTCGAFNADFDGDQMAVHLPLTDEAQREAREFMVTSKNLLSPSSGEPIVAPSQDMILGTYYLTQVEEDAIGTGSIFSSKIDAGLAYDAGAIGLRSLIKVRVNGKVIETTYGRLLFNEIVPTELGFVNEVLKKWELKKLLTWAFDTLGYEETAKFVDQIKNFGFQYSTLSGLSISKDDMIVPESKTKLLSDAEEKVKYIQKMRWNGLLTETEKYSQSIVIWAAVKKVIEGEMKKSFTKKNHIYNLIDSGARWNWWNITQLCGMKWLVASTTWATIELPIQSTLKEWFSTLEYFIATHGWRKWKADTALKTAQSGYLTRRLVDASQNVIVKEDDCETVHFKTVRREKQTGFAESFEDSIYSHTLATDVKDTDGKVLIEANTVVTKDVIEELNEHGVNEVNLRSILTCETEWWVCRTCYGLDLASTDVATIGTPVWVIAAQSIGEPGTQLTMRTFHSGWVASEGWDMTQGLTRVEELFEARTPKALAEISSLNWKVSIERQEDGTHIKIVSDEMMSDEYYFQEDMAPSVKQGQEIKAKQILAKSTIDKSKITAKNPGIVDSISEWMIVVRDKEERVHEIVVGHSASILVADWDYVEKWQKVTQWHKDLDALREVSWDLAVQKYIVWEIKSIYASQGQTVNSKHIELIVRQMFSRVRVTDKWDSEFFPGDIVDIISFKKANQQLMEAWKKTGIAERLLLGITKISLYTESWLSSASFQETVRVLVESSVSGKIDKLKDLKENVIIGRLIPAWEQYVKKQERENNENYFDVHDDNIDNSEAHMREVTAEMSHESDF